MIAKDTHFVKFKKVNDLLEDQEACGINSFMSLILDKFPQSTITVDELKTIFDYDDEGIRRENYRFNKLNQRLSKDRCPFKIYESSFSSIQDLFEQLHSGTAVPVFMNMEIIERFKSRFNYPNRRFNWGNPDDLFRTDNVHLLILVGYEEKGEKLYFLDPSYQLPYLSEKDLNTKNNMLNMNAKDFYHYVRTHNLFIELKLSAKLAKKFKKSKEKQKTLIEK